MNPDASQQCQGADMPVAPERILYTAHAVAVGGRIGSARSFDGTLDLLLATPRELGGSGMGTNPEQLFGACYAAAFVSAIKSVAGGALDGKRVSLPAEISIECDVGIGPSQGGLAIQIDMRISIPGLERSAAEHLVKAASRASPYSVALQGNVQETITLV
jgi:osmotically inducible protein OsmC